VGAETAATDDLKTASEIFKDEARDVSPEHAPKTVNTDGWKATQVAWKTVFPKQVVLLCLVHAWLKIRDRAKRPKEVFARVSRLVGETYHAADRRGCAQRLRSLRQRATGQLTRNDRSRPQIDRFDQEAPAFILRRISPCPS
jgi:hypothetical protein